MGFPHELATVGEYDRRNGPGENGASLISSQ